MTINLKGKWRAPVYIWSGLTSGNQMRLQRGLREIAAAVGDTLFIPSGSGYDHIDDVARAVVDMKAPSIVCGGHSNGGFAAPALAAELKQFGVRCYVFCFDRTLKWTPPLGSNVPAALDIWAGLRTLKPGDDFTGTLQFEDFHEESHTGVINNKRAQQLAISFCRRWKMEGWPS